MISARLNVRYGLLTMKTLVTVGSNPVLELLAIKNTLPPVRIHATIDAAALCHA